MCCLFNSHALQRHQLENNKNLKLCRRKLSKCKNIIGVEEITVCVASYCLCCVLLGRFVDKNVLFDTILLDPRQS